MRALYFFNNRIFCESFDIMTVVSRFAFLITKVSVNDGRSELSARYCSATNAFSGHNRYGGRFDFKIFSSKAFFCSKSYIIARNVWPKRSSFLSRVRTSRPHAVSLVFAFRLGHAEQSEKVWQMFVTCHLHNAATVYISNLDANYAVSGNKRKRRDGITDFYPPIVKQEDGRCFFNKKYGLCELINPACFASI